MLTAVWVISAPDFTISINAAITLEGAGKNRVSINPTRAQISHTSNKPTGDATLNRRSRPRRDRLQLLRGAVRVAVSMVISPCPPARVRAAPQRGDWPRCDAQARRIPALSADP